jgi:hypothetical protein
MEKKLVFKHNHYINSFRFFSWLLEVAMRLVRRMGRRAPAPTAGEPEAVLPIPPAAEVGVNLYLLKRNVNTGEGGGGK